MSNYHISEGQNTEGQPVFAVAINGWGTGVNYPSRQVAEQVGDLLTVASADYPAHTSALRYYNMIMALMPDAQIETDEYGQVIIYTNLKEVGHSSRGWPEALEPMSEEDFE